MRKHPYRSRNGFLVASRGETLAAGGIRNSLRIKDFALRATSWFRQLEHGQDKSCTIRMLTHPAGRRLVFKKIE